MPSFTPEAIANEFLRRRNDDTWPPQMYVQKLTYIAHGWNLAINNQPLIRERAQAWDNGPVYRSMWDQIKEYGYNGPSCTLVNFFSGKPFSAALSSDERAVIEHVWKKYGGKTAPELSEMTHERGTPWYKAYYFRGRNSELSDDEIKAHYVKLARLGREQRSIST